MGKLMVPGAFRVRCQKAVCQILRRGYPVVPEETPTAPFSHLLKTRRKKDRLTDEKTEHVMGKTRRVEDGEKKPSVRTRNKPVVTANRQR